MSQLQLKISNIEKEIKNPKKGLKDEVFFFIGRLTPYINVDLLIQCPKRGTLLTWREDIHTGRGWHIPGGIIRFREKIKKRVAEVAKQELKIKLNHTQGPIEINEIITKKKERSHFISLLYKCSLTKKEIEKLDKIIKKNKKIKFFKSSPIKLLKWHKIYKKYL